MNLQIGLLVISVLVLKTYQQECFNTKDDSRVPHVAGRQGLYSGQQEFSLALLNSINKLSPNDNIFFSPYSTYHALLISYFIAGGQTEAYLKKALRIGQDQTKSDIYSAYKLDKFATVKTALNASYQLTNANKIYISEEVHVRDCMMTVLADELDFTKFNQNPEAARQKINKWVQEQTHQMIKDLLPGGSIGEETELVLVNAAYFKGVWENQFDKEQTKAEVFYVNPSKPIMVDMMTTTNTFNYGVSQELQAHILEMPYKGDDISMYILLPPFSKPDAMEHTLKKLSLAEFRNVVENNGLSKQTVNVKFPKFSLEKTTELVPILENIGIGDLFKPTSNLTGISEKPIKIDSALHKARIEINEEGTKASAATVLFLARSGRVDNEVFECNHPFVYIIYDKAQKAILFSGVFRRPY